MLDPRKVFANLDTEWIVPTDLPYFAGHFPGQPVFPAVGIVDASLEMIRKKSSNPRLNLLSIPSAKFTSPIGPEARVHVEISQVSDSDWQIDWMDAMAREKKFASLRLTVGET